MFQMKVMLGKTALIQDMTRGLDFNPCTRIIEMVDENFIYMTVQKAFMPMRIQIIIYINTLHSIHANNFYSVNM